jgi:disulfide bond formation protein DsbB
MPEMSRSWHAETRSGWQNMMYRALDPPIACLLLALVSAAALVSALALEYLGDLPPCQLCVWQRWPYLALIVLGLLGWRTAARPILALAVLILLGEAGLALYHVGVEQGWWALPASCAAGAEAESIEDLKRLLTEAPPACDQVSVTLFGLSLASWNVVSSLVLALLTTIAASAQRGEAARQQA